MNNNVPAKSILSFALEFGYYLSSYGCHQWPLFWRISV